MSQLGLTLPRETLANWCIDCAEQYLVPLYQQLHRLLIKRDVICADETTCQVLHEKGRVCTSHILHVDLSVKQQRPAPNHPV
ncbi:MAG: IS66 family transposase [Lachnospiraceae bacterium]